MSLSLVVLLSNLSLSSVLPRGFGQQVPLSLASLHYVICALQLALCAIHLDLHALHHVLSQLAVCTHNWQAKRAHLVV